mgnify:CR=1 FL=1
MNLPKNKHLIIFDFDETLCKNNEKIPRTDRHTNHTTFITPGEYSRWRETGEYDLNPSRWELDFSQFTGYPMKGEPIEPVINKLREAIDDKSYVCALVTGRDELSGPREFLDTILVDTHKMILMCSGDPNKRPAFESLINTLLPKSVTVYEDCPSYIKQCEEVCKKYNLPCIAVLVSDGALNYSWNEKRN